MRRCFFWWLYFGLICLVLSGAGLNKDEFCSLGGSRDPEKLRPTPDLRLPAPVGQKYLRSTGKVSGLSPPRFLYYAYSTLRS